MQWAAGPRVGSGAGPDDPRELWIARSRRRIGPASYGPSLREFPRFSREGTERLHTDFGNPRRWDEPSMESSLLLEAFSLVQNDV